MMSVCTHLRGITMSANTRPSTAVTASELPNIKSNNRRMLPNLSKQFAIIASLP